MADPDVDWETCGEDGCAGACLPAIGTCWAHAADADVDQALKRLGEDGRLDARGVPITEELLGRLLAAAPPVDHGHAVLTEARFDRATFQGTARFYRVTFKGDTWFERATFAGIAEFARATFQSRVVFTGATFEGNTRFSGATFQTFARFDGAIFQRHARFSGATFQGNTRFDQATFHRHANFEGAAFEGDTRFGGAIFRRGVGFAWVTFQRTRRLGPIHARKSLILDGAIFHERTQIDISAAAVCCRRARFLAGVQLRVRWAQIVLDDADLAAPSILTGATPFQGLQEGRWARALTRLARLQASGARADRPRLVSVRRADVAGLTVAGVNLRACRFAGAHHLDRLRVEEADFPYTPSGWRWTTRQTIAEEHHWRMSPNLHSASNPNNNDTRTDTARSGTAGRTVGWYRSANQPPAWLEVEPPTPAQVAAHYRALRKGREDNKDEPGAADFYFGEMEMRRHAKREEATSERRYRHYRHWAIAVAEHAVLWLYWLVSGYGLRAWRALTALTVAVLLASGIFAFWGFAPPDEPAIRPVAVNAQGTPIYARQPVQRPIGLHELPTAIRFSAQATTALLRGPDRPLTPLGEWLDMGLRLIGPVLLGLAVLSIRSRIKR